MADLSLTDALTDSVPDTEDVVERDFVATLEAETFDDQVGETVGKTDFVPLLDNDGKGGVSPLGSSGLISAPWPETQGDVRPHQTDQQDFGTDFLTGSMSGFSHSSSPQMIDSSPIGAFSGFSEPGVMLNTAASPVPLQTERPFEPHSTPAVQVTETPKIPAEPLIAMTPKSPADTSAGVFGERWSDEAGIPSDLPFTPSVSTVISRHASHLTESPHDAPDPHWSPRDSLAGDERETEASDRKKDKKKKKRRPRDDVFDTELQSESAESPHRSSPRKERDREGDWEDIGRVGGRVKKPKSRKKIPEEWAIHAEPFVPASASVSQEFGSDSGLMSLSEDYTDESFIPLSLTQDLLSLTATSPPSTLQPAVTSQKSPGQTSGLSVSSGFHEIIMETDSAFQGYPKDAFESPLGKAASLTPAGAFEEAMFEQEPYTPPPVMSLLESPMKEPQMSTPETTRFVPPMEALISAPPFSPSGPAWSLNNHNLSSVTPAPFPSPKNKTPKESKQGKKSRSSSSKSPSTPDGQLPSPQSSGLNPAAPPFFPSFAEPLEPQAFTSEENCEKNKPDVNKTDNIQKSDNSDVINKMQKDEKTLELKDKTEHTHQIELKDTPEKMKETATPDKNKEKIDKIEKVDKIETPVKVEVTEKVDPLEKPLTKDVSEKDEKPTEKREMTEKTDSSLSMDNEKVDQVKKPEVKTEKVKADENESNRDTAEDNKPDLKLEKDKVVKEQKTDEVKVEQKTEKVESADKKSAKAEKDEKGEKAKRPAAKPAVSNGVPAKDSSSPAKKTKPVAGATKPISTKPRPSSSSTAPPAPKRPTPTSSTSAPAPLSKKAPVLKAPPPSAGTKRPATASTRPHTATTSGTAAKEVKPKTATEKRPLVPKVSSAPARPAAPKNSSSTTAENKPATTTTRTSTTTRPTASTPATRRPVTKTDGKPEEKKATTLKTTDAARSKTAPLRTSTATSRISACPTKTPPTTAAADKKPPVPRASRPNSTTTSATARPAPHPGSASATDIKIVRSKIGSTDNIKHQPGGGKVTVSQNRTDTQSKDISQGKVQILSKKMDYSHVTSRLGSKDNMKHVPGGGNIQILNKKVDVSKVTSKCDSKANMKHKPGGGDVKIESHKMNYKDKAQSKIGSMDNVNHEPGGGKVKIESFKLHFREKARSRTDHGADIIIWPASADGSAQPHLLRNSVSLNDSLATAGLPRSHTTPTLLSSQEQGGIVGSLDGLLT
ncbi:microtubule-associated protein 4 isoform X3 [Triplophysa rosa]|uniref:microtubule-associated protein 4 isoform X3 n=1 Tax=Triplophysa rosa TaxID=992332 RepID=UPI002545E1A9|nr:microtubule-associated protein 4 isoform X3 [Triplophysa rosa]